MKLTRIAPLLVAALLPLAACDSGTDSDDLDFGEFRGRVTGEFTANLEGSARSGNTPGFGQDQVLLTDLGENVEIIIFHQDDEFIEGTEALAGLNDDTGVTAAIFFGDEQRAFIATGGTIDIDDVTSDGVRGEIRFDAIEFDLNTEQILTDRVTVDVAFNADYSTTCCFNRVSLSRGGVRLQKTPAN